MSLSLNFESPLSMAMSMADYSGASNSCDVVGTIFPRQKVGEWSYPRIDSFLLMIIEASNGLIDVISNIAEIL